jgi:23S rRNA (adenine2503-C2)-methyltransferase
MSKPTKPNAAPKTKKTALSDCLPDEITAELGLKPFQGKQIFRWLHQKRVLDVERMTDLSKDLRARLAGEYVVRQLDPVRVKETTSGARKVLFRLLDGHTIESVLLRDRDRVTLCVSSQVGCPVACGFCATGKSGFVRNLTAGEIVEQTLHLLADEQIEGRTPNIVYMGMGEPFLNYDAVAKSIRLLMCEDGLNVGARRITVSTVGVVPGIRRFTEEDWQVRLAVSLHAANDEMRSAIVPINTKYPLHDLIQSVRHYIRATGRQISFEWVLLRHVNDAQRHAHELADLIGDIKATVNLIPFNAVEGSEYHPPTRAACETFRDTLVRRGIKTTLRQERGGDIDAACGQLRARTE